MSLNRTPPPTKKITLRSSSKQVTKPSDTVPTQSNPINTNPKTTTNPKSESSDFAKQSTSSANMAPPQDQPTAQPSGENHRFTIKPIQFIKTAPKLYFLQMEAQFSLAGITRDDTKYNHVLGSLDPTYLTSVLDIIENPPTDNKYEAIKNRIITEFQQSDQHKLRILLREIELGDLKPSQLLRKMRELSNNALSDDALKTLWIERLPEQIRPVISISGDDLNKVAQMADKMLEITTYNVVSEVATSSRNSQTDSQISALAQQITELSNKVAQLSNNFGQSMPQSNSNDRGRNRSRDNSRNRARSSSRTPNDSPYCFYHFTFGAMARKCRDPCKFKAPAETKNGENQSKN